MGFRHTNRNPFLANLNTFLGVKFDVPSIPKVNPAVIPALFLRNSLRDFFLFIFDSPLLNRTPTVLEHLFNKIVPNQVLLHLTFQFPRPLGKMVRCDISYEEPGDTNMSIENPGAIQVKYCSVTRERRGGRRL